MASGIISIGMILYPPWERLKVEARPMKANTYDVGCLELQFFGYFYGYYPILDGPTKAEGSWSDYAWKDTYIIDAHRLLMQHVILVGITFGILGWLREVKSRNPNDK
jgi:hypothetical protein